MPKEKKEVEKQSLKDLVKSLAKTGADIIYTPVTSAIAEPVEAMQTGISALDYILGIGGLPRGRVIEVFGPESGGKTSLCLHAIAQEQARGGLCAFVDMEQAYDPTRGAALGVDNEKLVLYTPENGEKALEFVRKLAETNEVKLIVLDSVSALVPEKEVAGEMGALNVGLQARMLSQAMRILPPICKKSGTTVIFINQIRQKVGVMYGSPETTSGGLALRFTASVRLRVSVVEPIKGKEDVIGNKVRVYVKKNKVGPPFREAEFAIMFNSRINTDECLLNFLVDRKVIERGHGGVFNYQGKLLGKGKAAVVQAIGTSPELQASLNGEFKKILEVKDSTLAVPPAAEEDEDAGDSLDESAN